MHKNKALPGSRARASWNALWICAAISVSTLRPAFAFTPAEQELLSFEKLRMETAVRHDVAALRSMVADDLTYVHSDSVTQTKQQYLDALAVSKLKFISYSTEPLTVHVGDTVAVTHGIYKYEISGNAPDSAFYTATYVREGGHWKFAGWQTTFIRPPTKP